MDKGLKIYVMTHVPFEEPQSNIYIPLHVGREEYLKKAEAGDRLLSYTGDNTGEHISSKNMYFSELTGLYWVWKNVKDVTYVGTCHYRRYLINNLGYALSETEICHLLSKYDLITTKTLQLNFSYEYGFAQNHKPYYLEKTYEAICRVCPEYKDTYQELVQGCHTYFGNILITSKKLYDAYMEWLFGIFSYMEQNMIIEEEDSYHRRIYGFISEFLQYVWVKQNQLKVYECMVGMLGEKSEIAGIRRRLAEFFEKKDVNGAKEYFLCCLEHRPDILMEASDITGELHLCMQVISIAGLEQERYGTNLLETMNHYEQLMHFCNELNHYTIEALMNQGVYSESFERWKETWKPSEVAMEVARQMYQNDGRIKVMRP